MRRRRDRRAQRAGARRRHACGPQHARQDRLGGQRREVADGSPRAARPISGFGHRVYRTYDPRAKILREMAKTAAPDLYKTAARTEEVALKILHEAHPERPNATNVDFWASVVLTGAGIPKGLFTPRCTTARV